VLEKEGEGEEENMPVICARKTGGMLQILPTPDSNCPKKKERPGAGQPCQKVSDRKPDVKKKRKKQNTRKRHLSGGLRTEHSGAEPRSQPQDKQRRLGLKKSGGPRV